MKRKLLALGLVAVLVTLMSSCLIVFPENMEKTWISEISYQKDGHAGQIDYVVLWDDGATYDYRSGIRHGSYNGLVDVKYNGVTYPIYAPEGEQTLRITLMFEDMYGKMEYVDHLAYCSNIDSCRTTTIYVTEKNVNVVNPSYYNPR